MKILLVGFKNDSKKYNLCSELKKRSHEVVYRTGPSDKENDEPLDYIFHDHDDAYRGRPATGVDISEFLPPGKDLIEKLHKTESLILTMMNKRFIMSVDERRHLYYNMLQYWHGVIRKYKPELIIFPIVPHSVYNYLIYELAHLLGIKTIMFEDIWVSDRALLYTDFRKGSNILLNNIEKNKGKNFLLKDLSPDLQEYYKLQTYKNQDATPLYMKEWRKKYSVINSFLLKTEIVIKSIKDFSIFKKAPLYFFKYFKQNIRKEYASVQAEPDYSKKFIYTPLNYQPERTSSPQGDIFVDQILMVEILVASLPDDWVIYVKEHPKQWLLTGLNFTSCRYKGYYKRIAKLKNVRLVPIKTDTYALINKAQAVATVTGTAGWEAILRLKPCIIFGYPWYRDCPGAFGVNNVESCQEAIKEIINDFNIDQQQIINYLKSFDDSTIHGRIAPGFEKNSKFTKEESAKNITKAILSEIKRLL